MNTNPHELILAAQMYLTLARQLEEICLFELADEARDTAAALINMSEEQSYSLNINNKETL